MGRYGGVVEKGDREVIHSDLYSLNLHKLDNFECLIESQAVEWDAGAEDSDPYGLVGFDKA